MIGNTTPGAPVAQWAPLDLSPLEAAATLVPSVRDDAGIAPDAAFALSSLTDEPAQALAERLEISPPTEFTMVTSTIPGDATVGVPVRTGTTYAPKAAAWANFDQAERAIRVEVSADRERYRPDLLDRPVP